MDSLNFDYHYGTEAEQYAFLRIPRTLITASHFKNLSMEAKVLYGLMLDRMGLSMKNQWLDDKNRVFIYFTLEDIQECLSCGHNKGVKLLAELDATTGIGLIERIKQGQGKPTRIYVKNFNIKPDSEVIHRGTPDFPKQEVQTSQNRKSRLPENGSADFRKTETNYNDFKELEFNDIENQSIYPRSPAPPTTKVEPAEKEMDEIDTIDTYREIIKENIDYDCLCEQYKYNVGEINEFVELMVDMVCTKRKYIRVNQEDKPAAVVKSRIMKIDFSHIEFLMQSLNDNPSDIRNIRAYLQTCLYNTLGTIENHYKALVAHDMRGGGSFDRRAP